MMDDGGDKRVGEAIVVEDISGVVITSAAMTIGDGTA